MCEEIEDLKKEEGPLGRFYITPKGLKYPSITTVLSATQDKEYLIKWENAVGKVEADKVRNTAARRGTRIHQYLEDYLNNKEVKGLSFVDKPQFDALKPILDQYVDNIRCQEAHLYSDHLHIAGQVDCIGDFDNRLSVIDFKTSKERKHESDILSYFLQATFYALAYEERTSIPINYIVILITVDFDKPQIFIKKKKDYIQRLIEARKMYWKLKNV